MASQALGVQLKGSKDGTAHFRPLPASINVAMSVRFNITPERVRSSSMDRTDRSVRIFRMPQIR